MSKPQIIHTGGADELVVLTRREYEDLLRAREDAADMRAIRETEAAIAAGGAVLLPAEIGEAIARGGNVVKVLREWRGLTQAQLSEAAGVGQSHLSLMETGKRHAGMATVRRLAAALAVPMDLLIEG